MIKVKTDHNILEIRPEGNFRLQLWISEYEGIDPKLFVYQVMPFVPKEEDIDIETFVNVASVADLSEYPADTTSDKDNPFYRKSSIDLEFESIVELHKGKDLILADIRLLITNLERIENKQTITEMNI